MGARNHTTTGTHNEPSQGATRKGRFVIIVDLPYIRIGSREFWIERANPSRRGKWFDVAREAAGTVLGFAWWDLQFSRV